MHSQLFQPSRAQRADAGIVPDIRAIAPMLAELEIIDVRGGPGLPYEHQLMLRAVERAHAGIGLVPDTEVLELAVDLAAGDEHLPHVPPAHADLMDRAVDGVLGETPKHRFQTRSRRRAISVPLFGALLDLINRESRIRGAGCEPLMSPRTTRRRA